MAVAMTTAMNRNRRLSASRAISRRDRWRLRRAAIPLDNLCQTPRPPRHALADPQNRRQCFPDVVAVFQDHLDRFDSDSDSARAASSLTPLISMLHADIPCLPSLEQTSGKALSYSRKSGIFRRCAYRPLSARDPRLVPRNLHPGSFPRIVGVVCSRHRPCRLGLKAVCLRRGGVLLRWFKLTIFANPATTICNILQKNYSEHRQRRRKC